MTTAVLSKDPLVVASNVHRLLFENEAIRAFDITFKKGERAPMHEHPGLFLYPLSDGKLRITSSTGESQEIEIKRDNPVWRPAEEHEVLNIGKKEVRLLVVEIKGR